MWRIPVVDKHICLPILQPHAATKPGNGHKAMD